ncbi:MAG TPA: inositol monophosphatase [Candidatus Nanoarchaeia archaeon]|nr:inositol monophosphatase [Candidatus Nanoarchaeia archaeon]
MNMTKQIRDVAIAAAKKAARALREEYFRFDRSKAQLKSRFELLTRADLLSEEIILKEIRQNFPHHHILSEETGDNKAQSDYFWIVDPLDGTTNFFMHDPLWSISIAVAYRNELILGIVYAPILDEFYLAEKDEGATLNSQSIEVSSITKDKVMNLFCHGHNDPAIKKAVKYYTYQKIHGFDSRQLGSAALELAYTAAGRVESISIPGADLYDIAAGVLLVKEAGGKVTDLKNKEWTIESWDMVASNGKVHDEILNVFRKLR